MTQRKETPSGFLFNIFLKIGDLSLQLFFPKIKAYEEGGGKNEDCEKNFKEIFHLDLPFKFLFKTRKKSIIHTKNSLGQAFITFIIHVQAEKVMLLSHRVKNLVLKKSK